MPNSDSPYGGYILVKQDGSVVWQVAAREFPSNRDTDGTLEYAIRVVEAGRTIFASRDGKCLLNVNATGTPFNARTSIATPKFLIVSGYDAPPARSNETLVGKSYYITGNHPMPGTQNQQRQSLWNDSNLHAVPPAKLPPYDLMLRYDDYDLQRAELRLDLDPDALRLCYQHWMSVRRIWKHYRAKPTLLSDVVARHPARVHDFSRHFAIDEDKLKMLLVWSLTYHHLAKLGIPTGELDPMRVALEDWSEEDDDIWLSRWRRVRTPNDVLKLADHPTEQEATAHWSPEMEDVTSSIVEMSLSQMVAAVDRCFGYHIDENDLIAEEADGDISGVAIICKERHEVKGSRTIAVTGLTQPGTFVLMWHGAAGQPICASHSH